MKKILLTVFLLMLTTQASAWVSKGFVPKNVSQITVNISDQANDGCWTNIGEVKRYAEDKLEDNLTPASAMMYSFSTIVCVPTSRAQDVALCLGAQAGPKRLKKVLSEAGFDKVRISDSTTSNLVFEALK